jgi:hypothetical protein
LSSALAGVPTGIWSNEHRTRTRLLKPQQQQLELLLLV